MDHHQDHGAEIRAAVDRGDGATAEALLARALFGESAPPAEDPTES